MGVGATARISRHGWQSRLCGPSDKNSRSHRKHSLRFILVLLRTGFTRALTTRGISASYPGKISSGFFFAIGLRGASFPPLESLYPHAGFSDHLDEIMLGDDANAELNRHSTLEDERGGHYIVTA